MIKFALVLAVIATGLATSTPRPTANSSTAAAVGGGLAHPWRSPYKTA